MYIAVTSPSLRSDAFLRRWPPPQKRKNNNNKSSSVCERESGVIHVHPTQFILHCKMLFTNSVIIINGRLRDWENLVYNKTTSTDDITYLTKQYVAEHHTCITQKPHSPEKSSWLLFVATRITRICKLPVDCRPLLHTL